MITLVLAILLVLFVIGFIGARTPQGQPYVWIPETVGALILILLACIALGWVRA